MASETPAASAIQAQAIDTSWITVAASTVGLTLSLGTLVVYSFGVFVRPLHAEFGWSPTQIAGALAISQLSLALSSPIWGYLIDRLGPRVVILTSIVCLSALFASLALLTPSIWHFYLVFGAISFTAGGATPLGYCAVLVRKFDRHLGLALGLCLMGVGVGAAALPPLSQALTATFGWRGAYAVLGGLTLLLTLPACLVATHNQPGVMAYRDGKVRIPLIPLIVTRTFLLMCGAFFLLGLVSIGALANLVPIMISRGFSPQAAAQVASLTGLMTIAGRGCIGWVLDRSHPPYVLASVGGIALAVFALLGFGSGSPAAYLTAALLGLVVGAEVDFTAYFVRRYFGDVVFGRLYGVAFAVFIVGNGAGPLLWSVLHERSGSNQLGAMLFGAACLAVALLALALPSRKADLEVATA